MAASLSIQRNTPRRWAGMQGESPERDRTLVGRRAPWLCAGAQFHRISRCDIMRVDRMASRDDFNLQDFQALAEFRYNIRRFMRASEQILRPTGLKPQHYQLLLHIKSLSPTKAVTIGERAERLQIQHHSTVELVDRMSARGLIKRKRAADDRRQV